MRRYRSFFLLTFLTIFLFAIGAEAAPARKKAPTKKPQISEAERKKLEEEKKQKEAERKIKEEAFKKAESLLYAKKTKNAAEALTELCENEYLRACSLLGFSYYAGRYGVKQDTETAIKWYEKCAEKEGNFFCHNELGRIYYRNNDYDKAFSYYEKGAKSTNPEAEYQLGKLYLEGKSVQPDYEKALQWLRKAAHDRKKPNKSAQCILVEMSYFGIGMKRSIKDTNYWLKKCDNPFVRAMQYFYGHGVTKDRAKAKEILRQANLNEALLDWNDFTGNARPSVGKKTIRDQNIPEDCAKKDLMFGAGRKSPKIETYAVKIFHPDYYYTFDVRDGFSEKLGGGNNTFEACRKTFYTSLENKRRFSRALKQKAVIKISTYKNACLGPEMTGICDLNLPWREEEVEEDEE